MRNNSLWSNPHQTNEWKEDMLIDTFYCFCDRYRALVHIWAAACMQTALIAAAADCCSAAGTGLVLGAGGRGERAMSGMNRARLIKLEGLMGVRYGTSFLYRISV